MKKNFEMNMSEGKILGKLIIYSIPLICTNVLQLLFNAADVAVLGMFVSDDAVAAVGATGALINLIIGLFVGLSVGQTYSWRDLRASRIWILRIKP